MIEFAINRHVLFKRVACSRLSVSVDDRKSWRATSRVWERKGEGVSGEPVSIVLKNLILVYQLFVNLVIGYF